VLPSLKEHENKKKLWREKFFLGRSWAGHVPPFIDNKKGKKSQPEA